MDGGNSGVGSGSNAGYTIPARPNIFPGPSGDAGLFAQPRPSCAVCDTAANARWESTSDRFHSLAEGSACNELVSHRSDVFYSTVWLCEHYLYPLYAYLRRRGYPADQAQDLTQEFFIRLLQG